MNKEIIPSDLIEKFNILKEYEGELNWMPGVLPPGTYEAHVLRTSDQLHAKITFTIIKSMVVNKDNLGDYEILTARRVR